MTVIGYVHPGWVTFEFHESIVRVPTRPRIALKSGPLIASARNRIVAKMLEEAFESHHLLFVDTDMRFDPQDIKRLEKVMEDVGPAVVSGACPVQHENGRITIAGLDFDHGRGFRELLWKPGSGVREVFSTGMAFTLIHRDVIHKLMAREPEPLWPFAETVASGQAVGEDTTFCIRAREAGYSSFLDSNTVIGHVKPVVL